MKIYKVLGKEWDRFDEYDVERIREMQGVDLFVYGYKDFGYDGSGMAIWRQGRKYGYSYLGHCSCNGPLDEIKYGQNTLVTLTQLRKLAKKGDYDWSEYGRKVLELFEEVRK